MPLKKTRGGFGDVMRAGDGRQMRITFATHDRREAERRHAIVSRMRDGLVRMGRGVEARYLMMKAASQADADLFADCVAMAGELPPPPPPGEAVTIRDFGEEWSSGILHGKYPDFIKSKKTSDRDAGRLAHLYKTIGDVPLKSFTKKDYMRAMGALPKTAKRPAARRQYGQALIKLLNNAAKLDLIPTNPIPRGMLPVVAKDIVFTYLYPSEDQLLLSCKLVPLVWRVLWGFLAREGCRFHEAVGTLWSDIDRKTGSIKVPPERTKNGRGLHWVLAPGTLAGLDALFVEGVLRPFAAVDVDEDQGAAILRGHLRFAGVDRPEVHESTPRSRRLRCHDLRSTYITLALMMKKSEAEIMQHTGHRSSGQIHEYDHNALTAAEMKFTQLGPLAAALGLVPPAPARAVPTVALGQCQASEGVTEGVTLAMATGPTDVSIDCRSGIFSASSPCRTRTGTLLRARDFKGRIKEHDGHKPAENDPSAPEKAPGTTTCHTLNDGGVTPFGEAAPISDGSTDPQLESLRSSARVALEADDWGMVAALGLLIDKRVQALTATAHPPVTNIADARKRRDEGAGK